MGIGEGRKKKRIIAIVAVLLLLAIAGGVLFFVLPKKAEGEHFVATFSVRNISATVSASYQFEADEEEKVIRASNGNSAYTFTSKPQENITFSAPVDIVLDEDNTFVIFTFTFKNNSSQTLSTEGSGIMVTLNDSSSKEGLNVMYYARTSKGNTIEDQRSALITMGTSVPKSTFLGPQETIYFQILVEKDAGDRAVFSSTSELGFLWTLDVADHYEKNGWIVSSQNIATGYSGNESSLVVPEGVEGLKQELFKDNNNITAITIPSSVTSIGESAFENCTSLTSVTFESQSTVVSGNIVINTSSILAGEGETILSIGAKAFSGCTSLSEVTLPSTIEVLPEKMFSGCSSLGTIVLPSTLKTISQEAFRGCEGLTELTIPSSVENIYARAFKSSGLTNIIFDNCCAIVDVTAFEDDVNSGTATVVWEDGEFYFVGSLSQLVVPNITNKIESNQFKNCHTLKRVVVPTSVTSIGAGAFNNCNKLTSITLHRNISSIEAGAFKGCSALTSINLPQRLTVLSNDIFMSCTYLSTVRFPDGIQIEKIGANAFRGTAIESFTLQSSVTQIGANAFTNCSSLTSVTFEESNWALDKIVYGDVACEVVQLSTPEDNASFIKNEGASVSWSKTTTVGDYVLDSSNVVILYTGTESVLTLPSIAVGLKNALFQGNTSITGITLNDNLTAIGKYSFSGCSNLQEVVFSSSEKLKTIGVNAFEDCTSITQLDFPASVSTFETNACIGCSSLGRITLSQVQVSKINSNVFDDCLALDEIKVGIGDGYAVFNSLESVNIPTISDTKSWGFDSNESLVEISLPSNITVIPQGAFRSCYVLKSIEIPDNILWIGQSAFNDCYSLQSVEIPSGVTMIGGYTFCDCYSLQSVTIPEGVVSIGSRAFNYCYSLRSIELPETIQTIGSYAFAYCYALNSIKIPSSLSSIDSKAFYDCYALVDVCNKSNCNLGKIYEYATSHSYSSIQVSNVLNYYSDEADAGTFTNVDGCILFETTNHPDEKYLIGYNGESTNVVIPDGVTQIYRYAFYAIGNHSYNNKYIEQVRVTDVVIPNSVKTIGEKAFYYCNSLQSVTYADASSSQLASIGQYAFSYCPHLLSITAVNNLSLSNSLDGCFSLVDFYNVSGGSTTAGRNVINRYTDLADKGTFEITSSGLVLYTYPGSSEKYLVSYVGLSDNVVIPSGVTIILNHTFYNNKTITSIQIPSSVKIIESEAFYYCSNLESVTIEDTETHPSALLEIGDSCFHSCSKLSSFVLPRNVQSIGKSAFYWCQNMLSITIPSSVTSIGQNAFQYCYHLAEVINDSDLLVESAIGKCFTSSEQKGTFSTLVVSGNTYLLYNYGQEVCLIQYQRASSFTATYDTLPTSITAIANRAFYQSTGIFNFANYQAYFNIKICGKDSSTPTLYIGGKKIEKLSIPSGIISIPDYAFCNQRYSSITLPSSLKTIGDYAFYNCFRDSSNTTSITIPASVESIGKYSFGSDGYESNYLESVSFGVNSKLKTIDDGAFYGQMITSIVIPKAVEVIGAYAFSCDTSSNSYYSKLSSIIFENGSALNTIGDYAFKKCQNLAELSLPGNSISIGAGAFEGCSSLTRVVSPSLDDWLDITFATYYSNPLCVGGSNTELYFANEKAVSVSIPDTFSKIGDYAFYNCQSITSICIPSSIKSIGKSAFGNCSQLTLITVDSIDAWSSISLGDSASLSLSNRTLQVGTGQGPYELTLQEGITTISDYAFYCWGGLTSIVIPEGVTSIGNYAFYRCTSLVSITIPASVKTIGEFAFDGCGNLATVTIASGSVLEKISKYAFRSCSITSITIPSTVKTIESYAFYGCTKLGSITFAENSILETIESYAFYNCGSHSSVDLFSITIPASVKTMGSYAFCICSHLDSIVFEDSSLLELIDLYTFSGCTALQSVTFASNGHLNKIGQRAFNSCKALSYISIPEGVTEIDSYAFIDCVRLQKVVIPSSVENINNLAFSGCRKLMQVVNKSSSIDAEIGSDRYGYLCYYALELSDDENSWTGSFSTENDFVIYSLNDKRILVSYVGGDAQLTIPSSVTSIYANAFYENTSITSVSIPSSVTLIGRSAFYNCSNLQTIALQEGLEIIAPSAFYGTHISSITIPDSVVSIGDSAFSNCTYLETFTLSESSNLESIGAYVFSGCIFTSFTIPAKVATLGTRALYGASYLKTVTMVDTLANPSHLTEINQYDFPSSLRSITIASSVVNINSNAFYNFTSLTNITFVDTADRPSQLKKIGGNAFYHCGRATSVYSMSVTIPASTEIIDYYAFYECNMLRYFTIKGAQDGTSALRKIDSKAFYECSALLSITLPASLTSIGYYAFYNCNLGQVTIVDDRPDNPSQLTRIEECAFYGCSYLTSINLPEGLTRIDSGAFYGCYRLRSITIPSTVTNLHSVAFSRCYNLVQVVNKSAITGPAEMYAIEVVTSGTPVGEFVDQGGFLLYLYNGQKYLVEAYSSYNTTIPEDIDVIWGYAFNGLSMTSITIPSSVKQIKSGAFQACNSLTTFSVVDTEESPSLLTELGSYALYGCKNLSSVTLPRSLQIIGNDCFYNCNNLASISIPSSVTQIGSYAFAYCSKLTSVVIPSSVTDLGGRAFLSCSLLASVEFEDTTAHPSSLATIGDEAFRNCNALTAITIPSSVTSIGESAFNSCTALASVTIKDSESAPSSLATIGKGAFTSCSVLASMTIPSSVTSIGYYAFSNCSALETFAISGAQAGTSLLATIGVEAFYNCVALKSIIIPSSVTTIDTFTFYMCTSLTTVTIVNTTALPSQLAIIGNCAFSGCAVLTGLVLPTGLTSIGDSAFSSCEKLTVITIPASVTYIGNSAFAYCTKLNSIKISSTSGWRCFSSVDDSLGVDVSGKLGNASTTANNFKSTYVNYFWKKF